MEFEIDARGRRQHQWVLILRLRRFWPNRLSCGPSSGNACGATAARDDPSVDVASAIAAATGESQVVVDMRRAGGEALRLERSRTGNHSHRPLHRGQSSTSPKRHRTHRAN